MVCVHVPEWKGGCGVVCVRVPEWKSVCGVCGVCTYEREPGQLKGHTDTMISMP